MTLEEFKETVDGAPFALDEVAQMMASVTDDLETRTIGRAYVVAEDVMFSHMENVLGIELG